MPSCICLNSSSEERFHFLVQIILGRRNYLTSLFFYFNVYLRTGSSHIGGQRRIAQMRGDMQLYVYTKYMS